MMRFIWLIAIWLVLTSLQELHCQNCDQSTNCCQNGLGSSCQTANCQTSCCQTATNCCQKTSNCCNTCQVGCRTSTCEIQCKTNCCKKQCDDDKKNEEDKQQTSNVNENKINVTLPIEINNTINQENHIYIPINISNTNLNNVIVKVLDNTPGPVTPSSTTSTIFTWPTTLPTTPLPPTTPCPTVPPPTPPCPIPPCPTPPCPTPPCPTPPCPTPTCPTYPVTYPIFIPIYYPIPYPIPQPNRGCCIVINPCSTYGCQPYQRVCGSECSHSFLYRPSNPCQSGCYRRPYSFNSYCYGSGQCYNNFIDCSQCNNHFYQSYEEYLKCGNCFYR